jgi:hypothetical protein
MDPLAIQNDPTIKPKTKAQYAFRLKRLQELTHLPLDYIALHPQETFKTLEALDTPPDTSTKASYATALCKLYKLHPSYSSQHPTALQGWQEQLQTYKQEEQEAYKKNELKPKQKERLVQWNDLTSLYCTLKRDPLSKTSMKQNQELLLFSFLLNIRPKRADLGNVRIYQDIPIPLPTTHNLLYLKPQPTLVLNDYSKTADRYGQLIEPLPFELHILLKESLALFPREYVFIGAQLKGPYLKNNSYSRFVMRAFEKHAGKRMGVSLWRSVYINANVDFQNDSTENIIANARLMGHSFTQQYTCYRKKQDVQSEENQRPREEKGKPVTCPASQLPPPKTQSYN